MAKLQFDYCILHMQSKKLVFVTNNATKSRAGYLQKFKKLGLNVEAVSASFVNCAQCSGHVAHPLCHSTNHFATKVIVQCLAGCQNALVCCWATYIQPYHDAWAVSHAKRA